MILRLKIRLLGISLVIWRRVPVPECVSLRELHGVVRLAMVGKASTCSSPLFTACDTPDLSGMSTDVPLSDLRFRRDARFRYVCDAFSKWDHKIRVEQRVAERAAGALSSGGVSGRARASHPRWGVLAHGTALARPVPIRANSA